MAGYRLGPEQNEALEGYRELVLRYHRVLDLLSDEGVRRLGELIEDSLRYARLLNDLSPAPRTVLDLGAGAGLPGIPIAIALPQVDVELVERRRRRAAFLRTVIAQLDLRNATVSADDVTTLTRSPVDAITAQGVGSFSEVHRLTAHLHGRSVWLVSRKGPRWREEVDDLERFLGRTVAERREVALERHGTLVAVLAPGGTACPQSG